MLDYNNSFYGTSDIVAALDWVRNNRPDVDVVNMSLGTSAAFTGYCDSTYSWTINLATAVNNLWAIGIICVVSSGNDSLNSQTTAPACIQNVITVGASFDNSDGVASFSNCGIPVDVYAPGVSITASMVEGGSATWSGTSMACPHVSAGAALLLERFPGITPAQIESRLKMSTVSITDRGGYVRPRLELATALGPDIDGDTMDDDWELQHFITRDRDGSGNWDGDGLTDVEEFIAGTDPTNILATFRIDAVDGDADEFVTTWHSVSGRTAERAIRLEVELAP